MIENWQLKIPLSGSFTLFLSNLIGFDKINANWYKLPMTFTVSITSQGQISIPAKLRRKLGLNKSKKALIREENGELVVKPVKDFLELAGSLKEYAKGKRPLSNENLDEIVARAIADEYKEKLKKIQ